MYIQALPALEPAGFSQKLLLVSTLALMLACRNCAPACYTCEKLDYENRCPFDKNAPKVFEKEGDLNNFFERLLEVSKSHPEYKPTLFSGPAKYTAAGNTSVVSIAPNAVVDGPWLMILEDIFSEDECNYLIQKVNRPCAVSGYRYTIDQTLAYTLFLTI
jgi:hypothetical protein